MGWSVSAGFLQIPSRVTEELNKLRKENHALLSAVDLSEYSVSCAMVVHDLL